MKYVCLGYYDEKKWAAMSESEQKAFMEECFAYDDVLRKSGQCGDAHGFRSGQRDDWNLRERNPWLTRRLAG